MSMAILSMGAPAAVCTSAARCLGFGDFLFWHFGHCRIHSLTLTLRGPNSAPGRPGGVIYCSFFPGGLHAVADHLQAPAGALTTNFTAVILGEFNPHMAQKFCAA